MLRPSTCGARRLILPVAGDDAGAGLRNAAGQADLQAPHERLLDLPSRLDARGLNDDATHKEPKYGGKGQRGSESPSP